MEETLQEFHHLKIQLKDIKSATNDFNNKPIGGGGFGKVYEGELSLSKGPTKVAIKRLNTNPNHGQGKTEFLKEIKTLSKYKHENLINLLGFCYEEKDKETEVILVYEYASRQSLEKHLASPDLTWKRRLKICLDAAKGLSYLHDPRGTHERLIHRDMKSANILLDDDWNAKVSDFGLSIVGPANGKDSVVVVNAAGTYGYCDQQYAITQTLTKESDVYSFGVVLFEVLCGKLCCLYRDKLLEKYFMPTWIKSYEHKKLNDIIFKHPDIQPLDLSVLEAFSDIAYGCLNKSRKDRPKMAEVVTALETAIEIQELLESQEFFEWKAQLFYYEELIKSVEPPLNYKSEVEFLRVLYKGVLLNGGKTWFSLNKKGEHCEMISFVECLVSASHKFGEWLSPYNSRFAVGPYHYENGSFKTRVKTQFLTPGIRYTVNLVFKFDHLRRNKKYGDVISLKYKLQGETESSISYLACERDDGWWMCELYQFTSDHRIVDLEILFYGNFKNYYDYIYAEGIEFRPLEKVERKDEKQFISDSDANCEDKLPTDYEAIMKCSKDSMQWTTQEEAYSIIRKGFLIDDGQKWFSLDNNGKKSYMVSATHVWEHDWNLDKHMLHLTESRFGIALRSFWSLRIQREIKFSLLLSETTYASYIVYKLPKDQSRYEGPIAVYHDMQEFDLNGQRYIYLKCPQTPIIGPKTDQNTHNPLNRPKIRRLPQLRNDGWMEVQIWEFCIATTTEVIPVYLSFYPLGGGNDLSGLIIQGVEFRPI